MGKKFVTFKVNLDGLDDVPRWYTIVTNYNYEQKVANDITKMIDDRVLDGTIIDVFSGVKEVKEETRNKKDEIKIKIKNEKVMANYVFVKTKMNATIWSILTNITGVSAILCTSGTPISTSDSKIKEIKDIMETI